MKRWTPAHLHEQPLDVTLRRDPRAARASFSSASSEALDEERARAGAARGTPSVAHPAVSSRVPGLAAVAAILALYRLVLTVNNTTVALSLLLVVLGVSARWGLAEATVASVVAVLGLNYYFLEPVGTFTIEDPAELGGAGRVPGDRRDRQPALRARPAPRGGGRGARAWRSSGSTNWCRR